MQGTRRGIAGIAVAAAMALTLGACGGSSNPSSAHLGTVPAKTPASVLLASVQTTTATKSAHISMSVTTGGSSMFAVNLKTEGDEDFTTGDAQLTMSYDGAAAAFLSGDFQMRMVGGVMYMKFPDSIGSLMGGANAGKWIKLDPSKLGGGVSGAALGQSDPTQALAYLEKASNDVKDLGSETVNGVDTTHYHATIDLGKSVDNAKIPPALREKVKQLWQRRGVTAPTIPADAWIDGQGRLVRMKTEVDTAAMFGGALGASGASGIGGILPTVTMTLNLSNFGEPVHVEAPPADQIIDLKNFGENGGGFFGGGGGLLRPDPLGTKVS